ncbi:hypothetical protein DYB26_010551 [Aphanomyces astaci]|uniref:Aminoglycoside phosphotransferase domain-containing protein n=1 Tax=Aphanomyces astaci TaxID=112090 RepID=A0A397CZH6_APHAT|nr:hypothetical protein DYB38_010190 [Aphanomyces astaci]RHZ12565.1 hypothetical protein DYB31_002972 [Aphanomyces astaci]RHZ29506.1 hypothetical protein DYB26_010551 [Aphanomyces astaci]
MDGSTPSDVDVAAVRRVAKEIPMWKQLLAEGEGTDKEVVVTKMQVVSANKILVAAFRGTKVLVKFPMENLFSMVFDLHEQKLVNDMVSSYRGDLGRNPKVLYIDATCRVDAFVECRTLCQADYLDPPTMQHLAEELAALHCDSRLKEQYITLKGGNPYTIADRLRGMHATFLRNFPLRKERVATQVPEAHHALANQVNKAMEVLGNTPFFTNILSKCFPDSSDLVFSHNDLSANNVLYLGPSRVQIIDFDGSNLSYRGADIGYMVKSVEMHGMTWQHENVDRFMRDYVHACAVHHGVQVDGKELQAQVERGKILALVFLMTMFGASDNWDVFHLTGFGFLATFPSMMHTIVEFAKT